MVWFNSEPARRYRERAIIHEYQTTWPRKIHVTDLRIGDAAGAGSSALAQHNAEAAAAAESSTSTVSNLATMATVTASGREVSSGFGPELAADNQDLPDNPTDKSVHNASGASRWSADRGSGPWWLAYEFPGEATISSVNIAWGNTYATNYSIQTSDDGSNWTDVKTGLKATAQAQWVKTTFDTPIKTRHIRMIATTKSQSWSLSVWEMRTMGTISQSPPTR